jgi:hypothetical protein
LHVVSVLVLVLSSTPASGPGGLRVRLEEPVACDAGSALREALGALGSVDGGPEARPIEVSVRSPTPGELEIELVDVETGVDLRRTLAVTEADCADVVSSATLLVGSWLRQLPPPAEPEFSAGTEVRPAPKRLAAGARRSTDAGAAEAMGHSQEAVLAPADAGPPTSAPPSAASRGVELELGLGSFTSPAAPWVLPAIDLAVRLPVLEHLALGLDLVVDWPIRVSAGAGSASAWVQRLAVPVGLSWRRAGEPGAEVELAPGLDRLAVSASGLPITRSLTLWDPSLTTYVGWRWALGATGYLRAGAVLGLRSRSESLAVEGIGDVLDLPPVWVGARVAVGLDLGGWQR